MNISNEFEVAVGIDPVWDALVDMERVATFLPGAKLDAPTDDGGYSGTMRIKVGPIIVNYRGTARIATVNEDGRTVEMEVAAKDTRGQGAASARITSRVVGTPAATRVAMDTDLSITGRHAQFGRGILESVAQSTLAEFARRLEEGLIESNAGPVNTRAAANASADANAPTAANAPTGASAPAGDDALQLSTVLLRTRGVKLGGLAALALALALGLFALRRRAGRS